MLENHQLTIAAVGLVKNYPALLACRFPHGLAEAGLFPGMIALSVPLRFQDTDITQGVNYYLSCWYKRSELGFRAALFFSAAALAGSFGGLLAAAIALMDGIGGLNGWAWIFIIEVSEHTTEDQRESTLTPTRVWQQCSSVPSAGGWCSTGLEPPVSSLRKTVSASVAASPQTTSQTLRKSTTVATSMLRSRTGSAGALRSSTWVASCRCTPSPCSCLPFSLVWATQAPALNCFRFLRTPSQPL